MEYAEGLEATAVCTRAHDSCALKLDGTIVCWGASARVDDLQTEYASISERCGLGVTAQGEIVHFLGAVTDFGFNSTYVEVMGDSTNACAVTATNAFDCWLSHADDPGAEPMPEGLAVAFSFGFSTACLRRPSNDIECWTLFDVDVVPSCKAPPIAPPGQYIDMQVGCGELYLVDAQGGVVHWSLVDQELLPVTAFGLDNNKVRMSADGLYVLRNDGALVRYGRSEVVPVVPGQYSKLSANPGSGLGGHACAIRSDNQRVVCWGNNEHGQAVPPPE